MIGFYLENELSECPKYWQNFIRSHQRFFNDEFTLIKTLNQLLKPYQAQYIFSNFLDYDKVIFEKEKDLTWFILKWN